MRYILIFLEHFRMTVILMNFVTQSNMFQKRLNQIFLLHAKSLNITAISKYSRKKIIVLNSIIYQVNVLVISRNLRTEFKNRVFKSTWLKWTVFSELSAGWLCTCHFCGSMQRLKMKILAVGHY